MKTLDEYWAAKAGELVEASANGWSARSQAIRFGVALDLADLQPRDTVLDYGCGTGMLADYLLHQDYAGVDRSPEMLDRAAAAHSYPARRFDQVEGPRDVVGGPFDCVFALGVWNVKPQQHSTTFADLTALAQLSRGVLVASLLRATEDPESETYTVGEVAHWAEAIDPGFEIRTRHLPNDIMVCVRGRA